MGHGFHQMSLVQEPTALYNPVIHLHQWLENRMRSRRAANILLLFCGFSARRTQDECNAAQWEEEEGRGEIKKNKLIWDNLSVRKRPFRFFFCCFPFALAQELGMHGVCESVDWEHTALPWAAARGCLRGSCQCRQRDRLQPMNTEHSAYTRTPCGGHHYHITYESPEPWRHRHMASVPLTRSFNKFNRMSISAPGLHVILLHVTGPHQTCSACRRRRQGRHCHPRTGRDISLPAFHSVHATMYLIISGNRIKDDVRHHSLEGLHQRQRCVAVARHDIFFGEHWKWWKFTVLLLLAWPYTWPPIQVITRHCIQNP